MARKIKDTPVLTGKDARKFLESLERNKDRKVPPADYLRARENYKRFMWMPQ